MSIHSPRADPGMCSPAGGYAPAIPALALALRHGPEPWPLSSAGQALACLHSTAALLSGPPASDSRGEQGRLKAAQLCSAALKALHQLRKAACPDQASSALSSQPRLAAAVSALLQEGVQLLAAAGPTWAGAASSCSLLRSHACSVAAMLVAVQQIRVACCAEVRPQHQAMPCWAASAGTSKVSCLC